MNTIQPLVSIIVITYNSGNYVLETLESAKSQSYEHIELIISDDGSHDNTIELCRIFLAENKDRFINSELITVESNTGIPSNCNRGVKASKGEWIKLIAGDDILLPNAITSSLEFLNKNNFQLVVSKLIVFDVDGIIEGQTNSYNSTAKWFTDKRQDGQKKSYFRVPIMLNIPTMFYHRNVVENISYYDEEIKLLEDQPFLIKCFISGYKVGFNDVFTVKYRKHTTNVMQKANSAFIDDLYLSFTKYVKPQLNVFNLKDLVFKSYYQIAFYLKRNDYDNFFLSRIFLRSINVLFKWS